MTRVDHHFATAFARSLHGSVEYSVGADPAAIGTMIRGDPALPAALEPFVRSLGFGADWALAVRRVAAAVAPDAYLFKVDWAGRDVATAVTLYFRFPSPPDAAALAAAMACARPFRWDGPCPTRIADALGAAGPRGVGLRAGRDGTRAVALYFKVTAAVSALARPALERALGACGLPLGLAAMIGRDLRPLYSPGEVGVIGVDGGAGPDAVLCVKFDPANVPLPAAFGFLAANGAPPAAIERLRHLANVLRGRALSYLGVKYNPAGFAGWKAYFSTEPEQATPAASPRLRLERPVLPIPRLPHF